MPLLGPDRRVLRPQPLLDYDTGSPNGQGYERCIGVRWDNYKYVGRDRKLYRFPRPDSHVEGACSLKENGTVTANMQRAARQFWQSLMRDPNAFEKPTFYLVSPGAAGSAGARAAVRLV